MSTYLPRDLAETVLSARRMVKRGRSRLRVEAGGQSYPVIRRSASGFAVDSETVPPLRGHVDLFEGQTFLSTCLIIASAEQNGEMEYEFKWATAARERAPVDFQVDENAPRALLGKA